MSSLTDAQAALVAANAVLTEVKDLSSQASQMMDMLQRMQTSAAPIGPDIMTLKRSIIAAVETMLTDTTAAVAAVQVVVTDLGG
jgi:SepF-like predicted cell division protein (DUF552 family)